MNPSHPLRSAVARAALVVGACSMLGASAPGAPVAHAQEGFQQTVLGPGLYVFQTRIDRATCGDADRTGDVTSYYAAIDGIPGSTNMRMSLLNSRFWPDWTVTVDPAGRVVGDAAQAGVTGPDRGSSHFEVSVAGARFTGSGTREYTRVVAGQRGRCQVHYDALLRRIDV